MEENRTRSHPEIWAKVVSWALSPNKHEDRDKLTCIQQFLFSSTDSPLISGPDRRGISLLKEVLESTENAEIDLDSRTISVAGSSGLTYSVNPSEGSAIHGHGARFTVSPLGITRQEMRRTQPFPGMGRICIVETQHLRRLVIGGRDLKRRPSPPERSGLAERDRHPETPHHGIQSGPNP